MMALAAQLGSDAHCTGTLPMAGAEDGHTPASKTPAHHATSRLGQFANSEDMSSGLPPAQAHNKDMCMEDNMYTMTAVSRCSICFRGHGGQQRVSKGSRQSTLCGRSLQGRLRCNRVPLRREGTDVWHPQDSSRWQVGG